MSNTVYKDKLCPLQCGENEDSLHSITKCIKNDHLRNEIPNKIINIINKYIKYNTIKSFSSLVLN